MTGKVPFAKAVSAADWEPIEPVPDFIAATGATRAAWMPKTSPKCAARLILADGGDSPGVFRLQEAFWQTHCPTPSEIERMTAEIREGWDDDERDRRAPHLGLRAFLPCMDEDEMEPQFDEGA